MATNGEDAPVPEQPHVTLTRRDDRIAVITIDCPRRSQNTLSGEVINQASHLLDELEHDAAVEGVIFASGKAGSFVAGADIEMIGTCDTVEEATALSRTGQRIFERIADFRVPVVAAIDGTCLGGGLELALACHARVCTGADTTRLGLPEVRLGLLPGGGGTQRLPRRIGIPAALDLMLTGRTVAARKAVRLGLVDEVVPATILLDAAAARMSSLHGRRGDEQRRRRAPSPGRRIVDWALEDNPLGRNLVFSRARRTVHQRTHGNYPAPRRIIECVETGMAQGMQRGLEAEAKAFGELVMTAEARELIWLYFATTAMKKDTGVADPDVRPRPVERTAVLGAGFMGAEIAFVTTYRASLPVRLKDVTADGLSRGVRHLREQVDARVHRHSLTRFQGERARNRVTPALDYSGFRGVDLVIEAVFEDLELKHRMIADIERECPERTIFASNTSSLPITEIARGASRPENVIGMHYFSPVEKMPLLEVIAHERTAPDVVATAVAVGRRQGKTPIVVNDGAGFYVNRILAPYINEALHLLGEGVSIDRVDAALVSFGFPVGPFKLLDEVGIDISAHVAPILHRAHGDRMRPTATMDRMIDAGRLGRKAGKGFYRYTGRRPGREVDDTVYKLLGVSPSNTMKVGAIVDRTVLMMLNEAVRCMDEGILRSARDGDIGAVFGIGFPPFRGGPFRYMDHRGLGDIASHLQAYRNEVGDRFTPAETLVSRARDGNRFYPRAPHDHAAG